MTHRLYVAALVLGLTTTGALCGDDAGTDTSVRLRDADTAETPPGSSDAPSGADDSAGGERATADKPTGGGGDEGEAQSVGSGGLREHSGELAEGDGTLDSGEYVDSYTIDVEEGQSILVDMTSTSDMDPYIILKSPSGEQVENDDYEGDRTRSRVEHDAEESGAWRVMATSYEAGEEGSYDITIRTGAGGGLPSGGGSSGGK
jgi:hypothetical protein